MSSFQLFVICISRTDGTDLKLCYARSFCQLRTWDESLEEFEFPVSTQGFPYNRGNFKDFFTLQILTNEQITSSDADIGFLQTTVSGDLYRLMINKVNKVNVSS